MFIVCEVLAGLAITEVKRPLVSNSRMFIEVEGMLEWYFWPSDWMRSLRRVFHLRIRVSGRRILYRVTSQIAGESFCGRWHNEWNRWSLIRTRASKATNKNCLPQEGLTLDIIGLRPAGAFGARSMGGSFSSTKLRAPAW